MAKAAAGAVSEVIDGLLIGTARAASDRQAMQKLRISHMLICHPSLKEQHSEHFTYGRAPLIDDPTQNLLVLLPDALEFLGAARHRGSRVFLYCLKGISRSPSIAIALLMLERGIGFAEAWGVCERRRSIVYPNVGFQQQLRYLEGVMSQLDSGARWEDRLRYLRAVVPTGSLEGPESSLCIRDSITILVRKALEDLGTTVDRILAQPSLLQQHELWRSHGLFFENLHQYKALPSDPTVFNCARAGSARLVALAKSTGALSKGEQRALKVAREIDSWLSIAGPELDREGAGDRLRGLLGASGEDSDDEEDDRAIGNDKDQIHSKHKKDKKRRKVSKKGRRLACGEDPPTGGGSRRGSSGTGSNSGTHSSADSSSNGSGSVIGDSASLPSTTASAQRRRPRCLSP